MTKTILITGASSGFGRDTAETLARAGHRVYAAMRDSDGRNHDVAASLRAVGIAVVTLDVTDDASVQTAVSSILAESGRIDVLVNNAGIASAGVTEAFSAEQATLLFDTNVVGILRTTQAVLPAMRAAGDGLIINIGSVLGRVTFPFFGLYGATKFAVEALTDTLRYEVSQLGVDVALIQPSAYPTSMYASIMLPAHAETADAYGEIGTIPGKMFETFAAMFSAEGAPDPHDVASAVAALVASPKGTRAARTVVGQSFGADVLNDATAPVQHGVVEALGLNVLAKLAI